jgi:hypothetical protein
MINTYYQQNRLFQPWFWLTYIPLFLFLLINFSKPSERTVGNVFFCFTLVFLPLALLLLMRFKLTIDKEKIIYQYLPFQLTARSLAWPEIESAQLVFFDSFKHYWGYGYRKSKKYGWVYNTKGNIGLMITTKKQQRLNFEIIDQKGFCQFVIENELHQINLDIISIENIFDTSRV